MIRIFSRLSIACMVALSLSGLAVAHEHVHSGARTAAQFGYQNGYVDGFQHGREDRQARAGYSFVSKDYDDALRGYEAYMGSRERHRNGYRAGYDDGFHNRSARFAEPYVTPPSDGDWGTYPSRGFHGRQSVTFRVGYEDGLIAGEKDRRHNKNFRPSKHDRYEDADHGYSHDYRPKKEYKSEYREGFLAGYQRGYNVFPAN